MSSPSRGLAILRRLPGISSTIPFGLPFACRQFPLPTSRRLRALAFCTAGGCSADLIGCLVLPAQYSPRYVAAAALSLAADHLRATKKVEIKLPTLYSSFSVTEQGVLEVTKLMRKIYPEKEGVTNRPAGPAVGSETRAPNGVAKPDHNAGAHGESNATAPTREGAAPASTTSTASTPVAQRDAAGQSAESAPVGTKRCNDTTVELSGGAGHHPKRPKEEV
mmetsp:Transcript_10777/g.31247  ORF Transcript_10777/g.31247 Transcript_10777/m.31247 type:complete len:221 (+) Transcript_10777:602-1264(+)